MAVYEDIYGFYISKNIVDNIQIACIINEVSSSINDVATLSSSEASLPYQSTSIDFYKTVTSITGSGSFTIDLENVPWHYYKGDILIQYQVGQEGPFDVTWDATMDMEPLESTCVTSDNSDVDVEFIAEHTTLVQRFSIDSCKVAEPPADQPKDANGLVILDPGVLTINATNNSVLSNVITKVSFSYYSDFPTDTNIGLSTYPSIEQLECVGGGIGGFNHLKLTAKCKEDVQKYNDFIVCDILGETFVPYKIVFYDPEPSEEYPYSLYIDIRIPNTSSIYSTFDSLFRKYMRSLNLIVEKLMVSVYITSNKKVTKPYQDEEEPKFKIKINNKDISRWIIVNNNTTLKFGDVDTGNIDWPAAGVDVDPSEFPTLPIKMLNLDGTTLNTVSYDISTDCEINLVSDYNYYKDTMVF